MISFFLLLVFGNTVQAVTGFAGTLLIMPVLLVTVGRETAVPLVNFLGLFMTTYMAVREWRHIRWRQILRAFPWLCVGIVAGFLFQKYLESDTLRKAYGVVILLCVGILIWQRHSSVHGTFPAWINILLLISAGILHSVFASGGPMLVLYMMSRIPEKTPFRATMSAVWITTNTMLCIQHFLTGWYTGAFFQNALFLAPAVAGGTLLGYALYPRVSAERFIKLSYFLLIIAGIYSIVF